MKINIRTSLGKIVWTGNVRSKIAASRKTGEFIRSTGLSCTWLEAPDNSWAMQQQRMLEGLIRDKTKTLSKVDAARAAEIREEIETLKKGLENV